MWATLQFAGNRRAGTAAADPPAGARVFGAATGTSGAVLQALGTCQAGVLHSVRQVTTLTSASTWKCGLAKTWPQLLVYCHLGPCFDWMQRPAQCSTGPLFVAERALSTNWHCDTKPSVPKATWVSVHFIVHCIKILHATTELGITTCDSTVKRAPYSAHCRIPCSWYTQWMHCSWDIKNLVLHPQHSYTEWTSSEMAVKALECNWPKSRIKSNTIL